MCAAKQTHAARAMPRGGGAGGRVNDDCITEPAGTANQVAGPVKVVWTQEENVQNEVYRPYYYDRVAAGLDVQGKPTAWTHRLAGPSILARWLPPAFKDGLDVDALDGAVHLQYDIPAIQVEYVRHEEPVLNTGFSPPVGVTHNTLLTQTFTHHLPPP